MFSKRTRAALKAWGNKELEMLPHNISRAFICLYFINHGCTHLLDHWLVVNKFKKAIFIIIRINLRAYI